MISNVIDLTLALSKAGENAVLVTKEDSVINALKEHGKEIASKTGVKHLRVQKNDPDGVRRHFSVDYESVEEKYGDKTVMLIGKIATLSAESIRKNISDGVFKIEMNGEEYEIDENALKEDVIKPEGSSLIEFSNGYVFVEPEEKDDIEPELAETEEENVSD